MRWRIPLNIFAVPILTLWAFACTDSTTQVEPDQTGGVISLAIISGQDQVSHPGHELSEPLLVQATEMVGGKETSVAGVVVNFVVTAGGGSVWAGAAATDNDGFAADYLTLGPEYYVPNTVEVRSVDAIGQKHVWGTFTARAQEDATPPEVEVNFCRPHPDNPSWPAEDCSARDRYLPGDEYIVVVHVYDPHDPVTGRADIACTFDAWIDGQLTWGIALDCPFDPDFPGYTGTTPVQLVPVEYKGGEVISVTVSVTDYENTTTATTELLVAKK